MPFGADSMKKYASARYRILWSKINHILNNIELLWWDGMCVGLLCANHNRSQTNKKNDLNFWWVHVYVICGQLNISILILRLCWMRERSPPRTTSHMPRGWIASTWSVLPDNFGQRYENELMAGVFLGFSFIILIFFSLSLSSKHCSGAKFHGNVVIYLLYSQHHSSIDQVNKPIYLWGKNMLYLFKCTNLLQIWI